MEAEEILAAGPATGVVRSVGFQERSGTWILAVDGCLGEALAALAPGAVLYRDEQTTNLRYTLALHRVLSETIDALAVIRWSAPTGRQLLMFEGSSGGGPPAKGGA